jgi:hypothetical protein
VEFVCELLAVKMVCGCLLLSVVASCFTYKKKDIVWEALGPALPLVSFSDFSLSVKNIITARNLWVFLKTLPVI